MAYMEDYLRKLALWHTKTFKPIMTHDELELIMVKLGFVALPPVSSSSSPPTAAAAANNNNNNNSSGGGGGGGGGGGTSPAAWKEYVFTAGGCRNPWTTEALPRPRLPYPRIDGLHHYTYRAFCDAVSYFIGKRNIADHLHVRGMPLDRKFDRPFDKKFRSMNEEEMLYVYREGTLDQATIMLFNNTDNNTKNNNNNNNNNKINSNYNNNISNSISSKAAAGGAGGNTNKNTSVNSISFLVPLKDIIV